MMCHNLIKLWHIFQNDKSHEIVTNHLGTNFWKKKKIGMSNIPYLTNATT
jgi:hypothetical protein